jgi:adenylate cyclase
VASRLEGLTRHFDQHSILISGELRDLLGDAVEVIDLGPQMVKGWPVPIQVFSLLKLNDNSL